MTNPIPRRGGARPALLLLLMALALTAWGCGESSSGGNFIGPGGSTGAPGGQGSATVLRLLFTRARIVIPNSSQVQSLVITLADSAGVTLDRVGPLVITESYDLPVPSSIADRVAQVNIEVRTAGGVVREVLSSPVTLIPGQITTVESANSTPAALSDITVFSLPGNEPSLPVNGVETLAINGRLQLGVAGTYTAGTYRTTSNITADQFSWASTDPSVANVSQSGLVTGLKQGLVDISATQAGVTGRLRINIGAFTGPSPGSSPTASPSSSPTASPTASPTTSPSSSPTSSPSSSPSTSPGPTPSPTQSPGGGLVLSQTNATTVVGGTVRITGTVNGTAVNVSITTGNTNIASATGDSILGVSAGVTNFTANVVNSTVSAQGNVTVVSGSLQSTLRLVPGTATALAEGQQLQFQAFARFASGNATAEVDVSNQCVWIVTGDAQNNGDIISFDSGFGNFTATRGNAGTVQVGAIFSNASAVATGNTSVTINRSNPTIAVRPTGGTELNNARIPGGGWSRLFEALATYPSGFSKVLTGADVTWTNGASPAIGTTTNHNGRLEVVTSNSAATGTSQLMATYTNSLSGAAAGTHTVSVISYTLTATAAALLPGVPGDLKVIPGATGGTGYCRPVTVTCTFTDKNSAQPLVMPLFTSPGADSAVKAGAISLYLTPAVTGNPEPGGLAGQRIATDRGVVLLTSAITPVGYTHLLRNVTTVLLNQSVLNIRVQYQPTGTTTESVGPLSAPDAIIAGTSDTVGGDRDMARTGQITALTLDGATSFQVTATNVNLRRGQGTNTRLLASYQGAGAATEDVTALAEFSLTPATAANARIGNNTNNIGEVKGRLYITAPPTGTTGTVTVNGKYPRPDPGGPSASTTVNITLP